MNYMGNTYIWEKKVTSILDIFHLEQERTSRWICVLELNYMIRTTVANLVHFNRE